MARSSELKPDIPVWFRLDWSPEQERILYRDWGLYYFHKQQLDIAALYYDKCLQLKTNDAVSLINRSICKRNLSQVEGALNDSLAAADLDDNNVAINKEICSALYELNQFENCKVELHDNVRKFIGNKAKTFSNKIEIVDGNIIDAVGNRLGPFILQHGKAFDAVYEARKNALNADKRFLWKILSDQGKCDVVSVLEKEELMLSPREIARRERAFVVFNQIYFNDGWIDVMFLKCVISDPYILSQSNESTVFLRSFLKSKYSIVLKFLKMLQARCPLYNKFIDKFPNEKMLEKYRESHLYHIQYQTHRNMISALRLIKKLRKEGKIKQLSKFVEEEMGNFVVKKTFRVMPWKFEFINEMYNTLGLALIDRLKLPESTKTTHSNRLALLLNLRTDKHKEKPVQFVFGDRSTYQEPDAPDSTAIEYKNYLTRLEKRIVFAKYNIELTYLIYETARCHLNQSRFDECCLNARKAIEAAKQCHNSIWEFLNIIMICKSHATLLKIERGKEAFAEAFVVAKRLKNAGLCEFIEECIHILDGQLSLKKKTQSIESLHARKRRSKASITSQ